MFITVRSISLGTDISNSDAARWHRRSERFLEGLKNFDLSQTYQHYQPGVSLMWLNAPIRQFIYMYQRSTGSLAGIQPIWYPFLHGISKFALVLVLGALFLIQMSLIRNLYNDQTSLMYGVLLALEPYMIGIDRWFHLTSLEVYFGFTAFLLFILGLKLSSTRFVQFSAGVYSLSVLSKFTSLLVFPLYLYLIIKKTQRPKFYLFNFVLIFSLVFIALFPAVLTNWHDIIPKLLSVGASVATDTIRSEGTPIPFVFYYPVVLLFKLSVITLVMFLISLGNIKILFGKFKSNIYIAYYIAFYFVFLTVLQQKIDRYSLVFIPPLILLVSSYVSLTPAIFKKSFVLLAMLFFLTISYIHFPVYSGYNSPLFGGTAGAIHLGIYDNSGEYFAQAAEFTNEYHNVTVYVPDNIESFNVYSTNRTTSESKDTADILVKSLDIDRSSIDSGACNVKIGEFGPKDYKVVFAYKCN